MLCLLVLKVQPKSICGLKYVMKSWIRIAFLYYAPAVLAAFARVWYRKLYNNYPE